MSFELILKIRLSHRPAQSHHRNCETLGTGCTSSDGCTHDQHSGKPLFRSLERTRAQRIYLLCLSCIISILNLGHVANDWHAQNKGKPVAL
jgi:hypothetical protein